MAAIAAGRKLPQLEQVIRDGSRWGGPVGRAQRLMPFGMDVVAVTAVPIHRRSTASG